jgi:hypothetical protein
LEYKVQANVISTSCAIDEEIAGGSDSNMASKGRRIEFFEVRKGQENQGLNRGPNFKKHMIVEN